MEYISDKINSLHNVKAAFHLSVLLIVTTQKVSQVKGSEGAADQRCVAVSDDEM